MSFAKAYSAQPTLLSASIITVEADLSRGLHAFSIVGLPDKAVEESRDRVAAAIKNTGYTSPKSTNKKIVISLAPADLKKEGPLFDLAIAVTYLNATGDTNIEPGGRLFLGELSLDGTLRSIHGVLPLVRAAKAAGFSEVFVPSENAKEAALIDSITVYAANTLRDVIAHCSGEETLTPQARTTTPGGSGAARTRMEDIKGQESAKRGLEIAAAGGHNIALFGPPGTGKTMLARAFADILPPLSFEDMLDVTAIHSVAGLLEDAPVLVRPPFRAPHHTASYASLVGGGAVPKPGEVTLAHKGVLFLDEFPEFERRVIDALRQPLEERHISVARVKSSVAFPADVIFIAAMNPCPCGNYGTDRECTCTPHALTRYRRKVSGPIIDRIDMWIEVPRIAHEKLSGKSGGVTTQTVQKRVSSARALQKQRYRNESFLNSHASARHISGFLERRNDIAALLNKAADAYNLSPRAYHRVVKLARTIADLDAARDVQEKHVLEALQYRPKSS